MNTSTATMDVRRINPWVSAIDIAGDITAHAESALMDAYNTAGSDNTRAVILNFTNLNYMNSSGIGLLVTLLIRAQRAEQRIFAYGLSDHYRQIFELTRLNEAIQIFDSEEHAVQALPAARV